MSGRLLVVFVVLLGCRTEAPDVSTPVVAPVAAPADAYTRPPPDGTAQQVPDKRLAPDLTSSQAGVASFQAMWDGFRTGYPRGVVLTAGMDHHGVPIVAADPDPAHLEPGVPALLADPSKRDPATAYALCLGMLQHCAEHSATMDGCVAEAPRCATETPWLEVTVCCPTLCLEGYRNLRASGAPWTDAMKEALVDDRNCHPGLAVVFTEANL